MLQRNSYAILVAAASELGKTYVGQVCQLVSNLQFFYGPRIGSLDGSEKRSVVGFKISFQDGMRFCVKPHQLQEIDEGSIPTLGLADILHSPEVQ